MQNYSVDEVVSVFKKGKDIAGSTKSFLKREIKKGSSEEKFVQTFKTIMTSGDESRIRGFVEKHLNDQKTYFLALAGYAHIDFLKSLSNMVFEKYAEQFNKTYQIEASGFVFKDQKKFESIVKETVKATEAEIEKNGLPNTWFMKIAALSSIFDSTVMDQVFGVLKREA